MSETAEHRILHDNHPNEQQAATAKPEHKKSGIINKLRARLAPRTFRKFLQPENLQDSPNTQPNEKKEQSQEQIEAKCFQILGYLEQYTLTGKDAPGDEVVISNEPENKKSMRDLESQLDDLLGKKTQKTTDEQTETKTKTKREEIHQKLTALLEEPQVKDKFEQEFNSEFNRFRRAKDTLKTVRTIDRLEEKLKQVIYTKYLDDIENHGKLTQSTTDLIGNLQQKREQIDDQKQNIISTASETTMGYLETQKLLEYKKQMQENNGFVLTPSRKNLLERIRKEVVSGKKIFLVGSTGTGKTELAFHTFNELTGGYEIIPWHEGTTTRDVHGSPKLSIDTETGQSFSHIDPGPYLRALESKTGLIHEEMSGGATRTLLALKSNVFKDGLVPQIATGNPKDENTTNREEMDPAILREFSGIEVGYMPPEETEDIIKASLIEENGVLKLKKSQTEILKRLTLTSETMQKIHNGETQDFPDDMKALLNIDQYGNTETTLKSNFLDSATLFNLFKEWPLARAQGQQFETYLNEKITNFLNDPKAKGTGEKETLQNILQAYDLLNLQPPGTEEKGYILPSQMAGETTQSGENPFDNEDFMTEKETVKPGKFSKEAKEALKAKGFSIIELHGESINSLKARGIRIEGLPNRLTPDIWETKSQPREVAVMMYDTNKLILPNSSDRTLDEQRELVEQYSNDLNIPGVKAIIGDAPDYLELASNRIYWPDTIRTETMIDENSYPKTVNIRIDEAAVFHIGSWPEDIPSSSDFVFPLIVPTEKETKSAENKSFAEKLQTQEQEALEKLLGKKIDVPPPPDYVTPELQDRLKKIANMEIRFMPHLNLGTLKELQSLEPEEFVINLQKEYPNWKPFGSLDENQKKDPDVVRNLSRSYWNYVKHGDIAFPQNPPEGKWIAVEMTPKPYIRESYQEVVVQFDRQTP